MRRILDALSLATLVVLLFITGAALVGPDKLPDKIVTHIDTLGQPDTWATRSSFEILPMIAAVVFLALTFFAIYSSLAKNADQPDSDSTPPLEAIILKLIVWVKLELMAIFTCMQLTALQAARHPDQPSSLWSAGTWFMISAVFITIAVGIWAMIRLGNSEQQRRTAH